ncbi:MAG TPA: hypothetical protein VKY27_05685 [Bacteriovoracaceae bacterium]|nr:hypothetical protein [Bacteriovoracaceae bacterium]
MKVYYKIYDLHPKRDFNRLDSQASRRGVHLKIDLRRDKSFADFFSHPSLGDIHLEEFLEKFKYQEDEMSQKTFHFLLNDSRLRFDTLAKLTPFKNHTLWHSLASQNENVYKYKLQGVDDFSFVKLLEKNKTVRLDANGLFTKDEYSSFLKNIDPRLYPQIEYIEDPFTGDWNINSPIKLASDFINNPDHSIKIYKPNREFQSKSLRPQIFSSYMGGQLGQWHCYCELIQTGDLSLYHGVHIENFYESDLFTALSSELFVPDKMTVKKLYDELMMADWKLLCSI